jgi:MFS family permease
MLESDMPLSAVNEANVMTRLKPWIVTFAASLFFFYEFIQMNLFSAIGPELLHSFNINAVQLAGLSSIYFIANVVFLFPAGVLLDRISTKRIIVTAMLLCIVGTVSFALASNFWLAYASRFVTGIGSAFCFLSCIRLASRWFPSNRMALITGLIVTMAMLGGAFAQTPMTILAMKLGWRHALVIDGILGMLFLVAIIMAVEDYPPNYAKEHEKQLDDLSKLGFFRSLRQSYFRAQNILAALYTSLLNMPIGIFGAFVGGIYLIQADHLTRPEAATVTLMIFAGTIVGGPLIGWISDTLQRRKLPMIIGALCSLVTISFILYGHELSYSVLIVLFFLLGFFTSSQVISYPLVAESNPLAITATAVSTVSILTQGGTAVYQPLFGELLQSQWQGQMQHHTIYYTTQAYHYALQIIPIGFVIALLVSFFIKETYGRRDQ